MPTPELLLNRARTALAAVLMCTGGVSAQGTETGDIQENRPVGTWTDYLPYHQTEELVHCGTDLDTGIWAVRTEHAVFTLDERTDVVERISTVRGMSGSQPTALAWDPAGELLIVGQASGSIDFFSNTGNWLYTRTSSATSSATSPSSAWNFSVRSIGPSYCHHGLRCRRHSPARTRRRDTWYLEGQKRCGDATASSSTTITTSLDGCGRFEAPVDHPFLSSPTLGADGRIPARNRRLCPWELHQRPHPVHRKTGEPLRDESGCAGTIVGTV